MEQHGIVVDASGKKFPLPIAAGAAAQLHLLEFEIPVKRARRTDKAGLFFFDNREKASAGMKQVEEQEAVIVAHEPAADRAQLRRLLKGSYEQRQNVVIGWADFGGTRASRRLVDSCLSG